MWRLLDEVAALERRVGALYERLATACAALPPLAEFWHEMAAEERLHALVITAAREAFPPSEPLPPGDWTLRLDQIAALVARAESQAASGIQLAASFDCAEAIEASELNAVTGLIIGRAGAEFSRLGSLAAHAGVDHHREKVLQARRRYRIAATPRTT